MRKDPRDLVGCAQAIAALAAARPDIQFHADFDLQNDASFFREKIVEFLKSSHAANQPKVDRPERKPNGKWRMSVTLNSQPLII